MKKRILVMFLGLAVVLASLAMGPGLGLAQTQEADQSQETLQGQEAKDALTCDGTARSTSTINMRRSTSNCDRELAALRTAARLAAAAAGRPDPYAVNNSESGGTR